jgi:hypothetical protein
MEENEEMGEEEKNEKKNRSMARKGKLSTPAPHDV